MAHMSVGEVQSWLESTKATLTAIDAPTEAQIAGEVLGRLALTFGDKVPSWIDQTNTPQIVRQIISMFYAGWFYDSRYAEVETGESNTSYGATLRRWALKLLQDVIDGLVVLVEVGPDATTGTPVFYPTDQSSTWDAWRANTDCNDLSLGPAKFGMGQVF